MTVDDSTDLLEKMNFLEDLPFKLKIITIMHVYKAKYEKVNYLRVQSDNFLGWVCPLLQQEFIPAEQYLYYETDLITDIYFLTNGTIGFVLPFKQNIVYIEINNGDFFGEIDLNVEAGANDMTILEMMELLNTRNFNLQR